MMKADPVRDETRTTHNYFTHGGNLFGGAGITPAANLPASNASTIAALKDDFNALLSALKAVGLMEADGQQ